MIPCIQHSWKNRIIQIENKTVDSKGKGCEVGSAGGYKGVRMRCDDHVVMVMMSQFCTLIVVEVTQSHMCDTIV